MRRPRPSVFFADFATRFATGLSPELLPPFGAAALPSFFFTIVAVSGVPPDPFFEPTFATFATFFVALATLGGGFDCPSASALPGVAELVTSMPASVRTCAADSSAKNSRVFGDISPSSSADPAPTLDSPTDPFGLDAPSPGGSGASCSAA